MCLKFRLKNCYDCEISNVNVQVIPFSRSLGSESTVMN